MAKKSKTQSTAGFVSDNYDVKGVSDYVVMELKYEAPVAYSPGAICLTRLKVGNLA
jgi:hypothetical protein